MKRKIYAISLLLSFLAVFGHMMVPHHHHESSTVAFSSSDKLQESHSHSNKGEHHHHHEPHDEEQDNQTKNTSDHSFPEHFHLSATDDLDFARANFTESNNQEQEIKYLIHSDLFQTREDEPPNISSNFYIEFERVAPTQHKPNGLRGPPSIA